jgi:hypothetical protein
MEEDVGKRVKSMSTEKLEMIYSPLKELRDTQRYPLGSMEGIYQMAREEYLNRDE